MKILKSIVGFFKLIRFINLFFIFLTQLLFHYCIIIPQYEFFSGSAPRLNDALFFILVLASVLIAAGGYIINDYFDINIDRVNKPQRLIVDNLVSRRWAMFFHLTLSLLGLTLTAFVAKSLGNGLLFLLNLISVILLWFYSTIFKKKLLVGNIIISLLSAWVVLVLYVAELQIDFSGPKGSFTPATIKIYPLAVVYAGFAFIISIVREIVKDMEDVEGDRKYARNTMPIVWGSGATKLFLSVWVVVLVCILFFMMIYALLKSWLLLSGYILFFLSIPLANIFIMLFRSANTTDYKRLSTRIKLFMLLGILSMIAYFYHH
jgi:4-hydroxybenzoate polyprenyltransferase